MIPKKYEQRIPKKYEQFFYKINVNNSFIFKPHPLALSKQIADPLVVFQKIADYYLARLNQQTNKRRNWKKEWNGYSWILCHVLYKEMKNALSEKEKGKEKKRNTQCLSSYFKKIS